MSSALQLHNTLTDKIEPFVTREKGKAYVYVCGITPYDHCHMGHARTYVAFDILRRWMMHSGLEVVYIQNVTDIDDKIIKRAQENKKKGLEPSMPLSLSAHFDSISREELAALGILPPTHMPKISEHIPQTIALIEKIIANKHAYAAKSGVYFDISSFPDYGKLSRQDLDKIRAGARIEINEDKRNAEDFALWKLEETEGATYDSPWGRGRPGWHIECSAMSMHYTNGHPLDLHGGGRDLIFPHHENEIAQSEGAGVVPFSRAWAHTGFLTVNGEKMAKSLGNFVTIRDTLNKWDGAAIRLFFALTHYRSPIDFSEAALNSAKSTLDNVRRSLAVMEGEGAQEPDEAARRDLAASVDGKLVSFASFMNNDLDTPQALAELFEASKLVARARAEGKCQRPTLEESAKLVKEAFAILGIEIQQKRVQSPDGQTAVAAPARLSKEGIESLILEREAARKKKDYAAADAIRKQLAASGVILEDTPAGVKWRQV
ncbi:MAG: cysteine--tRNA ligase [Candidatus Marsarchaeota archaeon]|nr:cysteine--tRNA ligase [Candidatus Marsarchaeota archaeon]